MPAADMGLTCRQGIENDSEGDQGDDVELLRRGVHASKDVSKGADKASSRSRKSMLLCGLLIAVGLLMHGLMAEWTDAGQIIAVTWNIAAINNNPFEYWITHDDKDYNKLMVDVQEFIASPGDRDVQRQAPARVPERGTLEVHPEQQRDDLQATHLGKPQIPSLEP